MELATCLCRTFRLSQAGRLTAASGLLDHWRFVPIQPGRPLGNSRSAHTAPARPRTQLPGKARSTTGCRAILRGASCCFWDHQRHRRGPRLPCCAGPAWSSTTIGFITA